MNRSILPFAAVVAAFAFLSSCQFGKEDEWNNPLDPRGGNFHPPVVALRDTSFQQGHSGRIPSNASSANSRVASVSWTVDGVERTGAGLFLDAAGWSVGEHQVVARATDSNGLAGDPDTATATIVADKPPVPEHLDDTAVERNLSRVLEATDSDGEVVRYLWALEKGGWTDSSTDGRLVVDGLVAGDYVVRWGARDDYGNVATDSFRLTVTVGNKPPVLDATVRDTALPAGATLSVTVGASDPDGSVAAVEWDTASTGWARTTTGAIEIALPEGGSRTVRWRARDDEGATTADTFVVVFVPAPAIGSVAIDSNLNVPGGVGDTVSFRWSGAVPGMSSEELTWTLLLGDAEAYSGKETSFDVVGVKVDSILRWRLVARNRFGDSADTAGTATGVVKPLTAWGIPWNQGVDYGAIVDERDGRTYYTVSIGGKTWMAQNLDWSASGSVGLCPGTNGGATSGTEDSCSKYGRLYTWDEVMNGASSSSSSPSGVQGICPSGWHVPSFEEWKAMQDSVDMSNTVLATRLKAGGGWDAGYYGGNGNGTDDHGFRAVPAGYCFYNDLAPSLDYCAGGYAYWWTTTESVTNAYQASAPYLSYGLDNATNGTSSKSTSLSLRCVRDVRKIYPLY